MKIYGQDIALEGGETVHINTANGIFNNTQASFNVSSLTTNITSQGNVTISADGTSDIVLTGHRFTLTDPTSGGTGTLTVDGSNHLYWNGTFIA